MLNLKNIISDKEKIKQNLKNKGFDSSVIDKIFELAKSRSELMTSMQKLEAERNTISKEIGVLKSKNEDAASLMESVASVKSKIDEIKNKEQDVQTEINSLLLAVPNTTKEDVVVGKSEEENKELKEHVIGRGKVSDVKAHYDIGVEKGIVDFERAVKMSGSRFWSYKGDGARLIRALENFMLDEHNKKGYVEILPPLLVNSQSLIGTGQLPKFGDDLFKIENSDNYLIPTAEVPLTNFYSNEIVNLDKPIMLTAYTPCFREEAGSGGKDMKGLIRAHQFNKVELVKIVKEEDVDTEFNKTLEDAKDILEALELPYREILLCTGDTGFSSEKTIDLEVWIPSEKRYREISSVSSFGDFQARRSSIRYKDADGENKYAFTINGSALAIDRTVASILEVYQNKDGSITIPKVLIPYMGKDTI